MDGVKENLWSKKTRDELVLAFASGAPIVLLARAALGELVSALADPRDRTGFALYGKRRIGKTFVFKEVAARLSKKKSVCAYFSLWDVVKESASEFLSGLFQEILDAYASRIGLKFRARQFMSAAIDVTKTAVREVRASTKIR